MDPRKCWDDRLIVLIRCPLLCVGRNLVFLGSAPISRTLITPLTSKRGPYGKTYLLQSKSAPLSKTLSDTGLSPPEREKRVSDIERVGVIKR